MSEKSYLVAAPLVIVRDAEGSSHHVYQGGVVSFSSEHVDQLVKDGMLVSAEAPAEPAPSGRKARGSAESE